MKQNAHSARMSDLRRKRRKAGRNYLSNHFSVIPIHRYDSKPLLNSWEEFQTRIASFNELDDWLKQWPDCNLAIVTGVVSDLIVLEVGHADALNYLTSFDWPQTMWNIDGAIQWYFRLDGQRIRSSHGELFASIEVRSEGGYIVVPPSIHPDGEDYRWEVPFTPELIAPLPAKLGQELCASS
jgi:hypothetical protein